MSVLWEYMYLKSTALGPSENADFDLISVDIISEVIYTFNFFRYLKYTV